MIANRLFDALVRTHVPILGCSVPAFWFFGSLGFVVASGLVAALTASRGLSLGIETVAVATTIVAFLLSALAVKVVTGVEELVYYRQFLAVLVAVAAVLWFIGAPVVPYLEITVLGVGMFLAFGRVGCLMVGCCYGRPGAVGVCYGDEHVIEGFTRYYRGIRLVPVQVMESLGVLLVVSIGAAQVASGSVPGVALAGYLAAYALLRFSLEFIRGDAARKYLAGISEAQWTSLAMLIALALVGAAGWVPLRAWHLVALAMIATVMLAITARRRLFPTEAGELLHPHHVEELALLLDAISERTQVRPGEASHVHFGSTSQGVKVAASVLPGSCGATFHYSISRAEGLLDEAGATLIARLIRDLRHRDGDEELLTQQPGVFHVLIHNR